MPPSSAQPPADPPARHGPAPRRYLQRGVLPPIAEPAPEEPAVSHSIGGMAKRWGRRASATASDGVTSPATVTTTISPQPIALPPSPKPAPPAPARAPASHLRVERNPGKRRASLEDLLPTPSTGTVTAAEPSPFSPTKKLKAMTLRSSSLNPPTWAPQPSYAAICVQAASSIHRTIRASPAFTSIHLHPQLMPPAQLTP